VRLERGAVVLVDLDPAAMEAIDEGLRLFLGLGPDEE
jgi:hypothetical protein